MAKQITNLGAAGTGAGGDDRRSAWLKAKANFTEIYNFLSGRSDGDDVATALPAALPVTRGGTGGTNAATGRAGLELGDAATRAVGTSAGNVMAVGAGGWLGSSIIDNGNMNNARQTGLYAAYLATNAPLSSPLQLLSSDWGLDPRWQSQLVLGVSVNRAYFRSILKDQSSATTWAELYHTGNTTRAADGTLKAI